MHTGLPHTQLKVQIGVRVESSVCTWTHVQTLLQTCVLPVGWSLLQLTFQGVICTTINKTISRHCVNRQLQYDIVHKIIFLVFWKIIWISYLESSLFLSSTETYFSTLETKLSLNNQNLFIKNQGVWMTSFASCHYSTGTLKVTCQ